MVGEGLAPPVKGLAPPEKYIAKTTRTLPSSFASQNPPVSPAGSGTSGSALSVTFGATSPEVRGFNRLPSILLLKEHFC